jgi:hypothetical protein
MMTGTPSDVDTHFLHICWERYPIEDLVEEKKQERNEQALIHYDVSYCEVRHATKQYELTTILIDPFRRRLLKQDLIDHLGALKPVSTQWGEWVKL